MVINFAVLPISTKDRLMVDKVSWKESYTVINFK